MQSTVVTTKVLSLFSAFDAINSRNRRLRINRLVLAVLLAGVGVLAQPSVTPVHAVGNGVYDVATANAFSGSPANGYSCGVFDGFLKCWGRGPLGRGSATSDAIVPALVNNGGGFVNDGTATAVAIGQIGGCVVVEAKTVYCWSNASSTPGNMLGNGSAASGTSYAPSKVSTVVGGFDNSGSTVISKVVVGYRQACAIQLGKLYCWGEGYDGSSTGTTVTYKATPTLVPANVTSGWNNDGQVKDVDLAYQQMCMVEGDSANSNFDTLYCLGGNGVGQLGGAPNPSKQAIEMPTGNGFSNGTVATIDDVTVGNTLICFIQGGVGYCMGGAGSGYAVGQADNSNYKSSPTRISDSSDFTNSNLVSISVASGHGCAIKAADVAQSIPSTAYCWAGASSYEAYTGVSGSWVNGAPRKVADNGLITNAGLLYIGEMAEGTSLGNQGHTCAVRSLGGIRCWGKNDWGQVGSDFAATSGSTSLVAQPIDASPQITVNTSYVEAQKGVSAASVSYAVTDQKKVSLGNPATGYPTNTYAVSPALPTGLSVSSSTGAITGTASGLSTRATYTLTATNAAGSSSVTFDLAVVNPPPPDITLSNATLYALPNTSFSSGYNITNAGGPVSVGGYSLSPALPSGMTLNSSTGLISGTPTATKVRTTHTLTATGPGGSDTVDFTLAVTGVNPLITLSASSGTATVGVAASGLYTVTENTNSALVTAYAISPTLSPGLSFSTSTGLISGTPTSPAGQVIYTITASSDSGSNSRTFTLIVQDAAPSIALSNTTGTATKGSSANSLYTITNTGGAPASYSITPSVPAGMSFDTSTGLISGTPTAEMSATAFTVVATNTTGTSSAIFTLIVQDAAPSIALSNTTGTATKGSLANSLYAITNTGGAPASYSITPSVPAGMSFDTSTGLISGTPTAEMSATAFTVVATNNAGSSSATFTLTVIAVPASSTPTSAGTAGNTTTAQPSETTGGLVTLTNRATFEADPGESQAVVNGVPVTPSIVSVDIPAAQKEPEERTPSEVKQIQKAADELVADLNDLLPEGQTPPVSLNNTETGAVLNGVASVPIPVEDVKVVRVQESALLVAGTDVTGKKAASSDSGGILEIVDGGRVATVAYGLAPGANGELYVMSNPILLDSFKVGENGTFKRQAQLPASLAAGEHTVVVATARMTVSLGLKVRERVLPTRSTKVYTKLPMRVHVSTFMTVLPAIQVVSRRVHSLTPVVCLGATYDVVFLNEGRCLVQIKNMKSGKVVRSLVTMVTQPKRGQKIIGTKVDSVKPILFETGTAGILAPGVSTIRAAKKAMSDATSILVVGHSGSALGNTAQNQRLSVERAAQIRNLLVKGGIRTPIATSGLGALNPVTTKIYDFAQRENRRVELYIIP